jgi:hypothetical protein
MAAEIDMAARFYTSENHDFLRAWGGTIMQLRFLLTEPAEMPGIGRK